MRREAPSAGALRRTRANGLGGRRVSSRLSFRGLDLLLHLVDGSREVEDESERGLTGLRQSAHYLLWAGRYLDISTGYD
jgi:hypothetical protein